MIRIAASVEGQTESEFFRKILVPYFRLDNIELIPVIISTKRVQSGKKYKGGAVNLDRVKNEISKLLSNFDYVTTFYDLYGFDIKGEVTADELEKKIGSLFNSQKLIPYIQKYEFETLLFCKPSYYRKCFNNLNAEKEIEQIISSCGGIENINNSPQTAPSKRIEKIFDHYNSEQYDKVFHGPAIVDDIGLDIILEKCDRFRNWINILKNLNVY
jgi:hypothetical protein